LEGTIGGIVKGKIGAVMSALIIIELANALRKYGLSKEAREVVDAVFSLDVPIHEIDPSDIRSAIDIFDEFRISPYDCVHAAVMKRAGTHNIISADKDFDKINWIKRLDPKVMSQHLNLG